MSRESQLLVSKIGIIGGGVSGIAALKQLAPYKPVLFEASDSIGGVWKSCSYHSTKLQSSRSDYEFSDFLWPNRNDPSFPSYVEVLGYLESYVDHFNLSPYIQLNSKVVELRYSHHQELDHYRMHEGEYEALLYGQPVWEVAVQCNQSETIQWYGFEFLVICTGKYGDIPKMPQFPDDKGPQVFNGKVMHALDYCKLSKEESIQLLKNKKVVVVGFKKSAIDLALECAEANQGPEGQPCTMIVRTLHWTVPHYWVWGLPFFLFFSTRSSQFIHERPNQTLFRTLLCLLLSPMRHVMSKFIESYLLHKQPLEKYGLKPKHPFIEDYASCQMAIMPENFFPEADKGKIVFKKASNWWFYQGGIEFEDSTRLEADVVIFATGYDGKQKLRHILPKPFSCLLENNISGVMPLYRGTIHPSIPNAAFVGYIESASNLPTAELRSVWLARLLEGKFRLPTVEKMLDQVSKEIEVMKRSTRFYKRHCISTFSINHGDEMCEEMGWTSWRKKNLLAEAFSPYGSQDYKQQ